jgi:molybdopterin-guanine dinucleotide biosynthesis protein A
MSAHIGGVILAGGRSARMGREKALIELVGRPVIDRVIDRIAPQVEQLAISANGDAARFAAFGLPVLADTNAKPGEEGPLSGILAGLEWGAREGLTHVVFTPSDAPFVPEDLVERLGADDVVITVAESETGLEPLFSLWPVNTCEIVRKLYGQGERAPRKVIGKLAHRVVTFETDAGSVDPFFNLNRPDDIAAAEFWIKGW